MFDFSIPAVTVDVLKSFLMEHEYEEDSLKGVRKAELVATIVQENLEDAFRTYLNLDDEPVKVESSEDVSPYLPGRATLSNSHLPERGTEAWNTHVMGLFTKDEKVSYKTGNRSIEAVRADGLRRVGELVLGTVLFSGPVSEHLNYSGPKGLPCANVKYKIVISDARGNVREYLSLGEVSYLNTEDEFLAFALLTAETRAKGRAWREALGVKTYAVEEFSGKKDSAAAVAEISTADWKEQPINTSQQRTIKNMAGKLNVDVLKLINAAAKLDKDDNFTELKYVEGKPHKYDGLDDESLMNKSAANIIRALNQMQQGSLDIDASILL